MGRTGLWFGYQHYDIKPDIVAIGKGVGNGYPVSVAVLSEKMIRDLEEKPFKYAQSHQNDPLGAAVVKEVIDLMEEAGLIPAAKSMGKRFLEQLEQLVDGQILTEARGRGLMMAMDVCDRETTERLCSELLKRGFIVGNRGSHIRIDPPLTITEKEIDLFLEAFRGIIHRRLLEINRGNRP
jgi:acetylornithine aminotransferase